jgi:signal transduction histidine kinase
MTSSLASFDVPLPKAAAALGARRRAQLREEARRDLLQRSQRGVTVYPLFIAVLGVGTDVAADHGSTYFALLAGSLLLLGVRLLLARGLRRLDGDSVPRFQIYLALGWVSSSLLSALVCCLVLWYPGGAPAYVGILGMTGVSAGIIGVMSIHRGLARAWICSGVFPLVVCNLVVGSTLGYTMAVMIVLFLAINATVLDRVHETYWRAQIDAALLDQRAQETARLARWAGMAEIAASVLHDVGNVLNSVRISAQSIAEGNCSRHGRDLAALADLLRSHGGDLTSFVRDDERGKLVVPFLDGLAAELERERATTQIEIDRLGRHLDHIVTVVSGQQEYARGGRASDECSTEQLARDAVELVAADYARLGIDIAVEVEANGRAMVDVHQTLQILVNLLTNARDAVAEMPRPQVVRVRVGHDFEGRPTIAVVDRGCGIAPEAADKVFCHGFTTKARGHGFGLHNSFLVAKAMGGRLEFASPGIGQGATFTLVLARVVQELRTPIPMFTPARAG